MNIENDKLLAELEQQRDAMEKRALAYKAGAENMQQERDELAAHIFKFKGLYLEWNTRQIDDDEFISFMPHYAEGLPGTSLVKRDALKQSQALELALAAIDRDPVGAREEISGMLLFLRSQAEGGA
jgi:hypothetical protein